MRVSSPPAWQHYASWGARESRGFRPHRAEPETVTASKTRPPSSSSGSTLLSQSWILLLGLVSSSPLDKLWTYYRIMGIYSRCARPGGSIQLWWKPCHRSRARWDGAGPTLWPERARRFPITKRYQLDCCCCWRTDSGHSVRPNVRVLRSEYRGALIPLHSYKGVKLMCEGAADRSYRSI